MPDTKPSGARLTTAVLASAWRRLDSVFSIEPPPACDRVVFLMHMREMARAVIAMQDACGEWLATHREDMRRICEDLPVEARELFASFFDVELEDGGADA